MSEINNYVRQRREHITFFTTTQDVRVEVLRSVAPGITQADMYPKARQLISDEEYLYILRDMFNLSNVLDDMEFTGVWHVSTCGVEMLLLFCTGTALLTCGGHSLGVCGGYSST